MANLSKCVACKRSLSFSWTIELLMLIDVGRRCLGPDRDAVGREGALRKLMRGRGSLAKTYWRFGVLGGLAYGAVAAGATTLAGDRFRDCAECPEMVVVPAGSYRMGSPPSEQGRGEEEGPVHEVKIAAPFAIGRHEVTVAEFGRFVDETGHLAGSSCWIRKDDGEDEDRAGSGWRDPGFGQSRRHPVTCVNWSDAQAYVAWLSQETGEEYRLPSESEWEYAARAGTSTARPWVEGARDPCHHANGVDHLEDTCRDGHARTAPVGSFAANGWGLHDMLGNVWEWTEDCWNGSYAGAPSDGSAWEYGDCSERVLRGGGWATELSNLRAANRVGFTTDRVFAVGFRVARPLARGGASAMWMGRAPFTIETVPAHARVRVLNIAPAYRDGVRLGPRSYRVEASAEGYETTVEAVRHGALPTVHRIALRKAGPETDPVKAGDRFRDCPECPQMVVVPAGSYRMGGRAKDEGPVHEVTIAAPFAIGRYEVTVAEFERFVDEAGYSAGSCSNDADLDWRNPGFGQGGRHPVTCVSWEDAQAYAAWLSRVTEEEYRLPSESEWEYAARAGTATARYWGEDESGQCRHANGEDASTEDDWPWPLPSCLDGYSHTAPAGSFRANGWGLHDMLGNVWEWTEDCWNGSYAGAPLDGSARSAGDCWRSVLRGGSWDDRPLRSASRNWDAISNRYYSHGFRVARSLP